MSSTFGKLLRVTTFGESHCQGVGAVVDGCPANIPLTTADIQAQLDRRRPGQSKLSTDRTETDQVSIQSGVENDLTLGTPISLFVPNQDQRPGDYKSMRKIPRPSHADYTYQMKYGMRASSGGGRSSARETIGRVAAGAVAEKILTQLWGVSIVAWVSRVGTIESKEPDMETITRKKVDETPVRCPDREAAQKMMDTILKVKASKDSIGGVVTCVCRHIQPGWGEPVFEKLEAVLAQAMLSIPATKGFEIGSGFYGSTLKGSVHNDPFVAKKEGLGTSSNRSGGIQGGISNGENIYFKVAFKPPATIGRPQQTVDFDGKPVELAAAGRHDPCVVNRAVPIVEGMTALVIADMALRQKVRQA
jgi:chorismate synthase